MSYLDKIKIFIVFTFIVLIFSCTSTRTIPTVVEDCKGFLIWDKLKLRQIDIDEFPTDTTYKVWIRKSKNTYEVREYYWLTKKVRK